MDITSQADISRKDISVFLFSICVPDGVDIYLYPMWMNRFIENTATNTTCSTDVDVTKAMSLLWCSGIISIFEEYNKTLIRERSKNYRKRK